MIVSYNWLGKLFDGQLPSPKEIKEKITMHVFEVESLEEKGDDYVFDIKVLPDRSHDALSHVGIAREISALFNIPLKKFLSDISIPNNHKAIKVAIEDESLCPRYACALIEGVRVGPSPEWLSKLLNTIGQKSINNIVDATNYVMFTLGQPLHAFDADKLTKKSGVCEISVRRSLGEKMTALDNKIYEVPSGALLITDGVSNNVLGIAGIKGGKTAEISEATTSIILESANFNPVLIRKTSKLISLRTDASLRFENGISPELAGIALKEVASLVMQIAGSGETKIIDGADIYPHYKKPFITGVSVSEVNNLLGTKFSQNDIDQAFKRLGFDCELVDDPKERMISLAESMIATPYKYGASVSEDAPDFFDCSSFTSYFASRVGISIPRISVDQYMFGEMVDRNDVARGDFVFANSGDGKIHTETVEFMPGYKVPPGVDHVGIYLGDDKIIHASAKTGEVCVEDMYKSSSFKNIVGVRRLREFSSPRVVVTVPYYRVDIRNKENLIEEVGRTIGYDKILPKLLPMGRVNPPLHKTFYYINEIRDILQNAGFSEVSTYCFRKDGDLVIANPLAEDKSTLRNDLTKGVSESLQLNLKYTDLLGTDTVCIFEIGNVFSKDKKESLHLAIAVDYAKSKPKKDSRTELSDMVTLLSARYGFTPAKHGSTVYEINLGEYIEKLPVPLDYGDIIKMNGLTDIKYKHISAYPFVLRDIAVFIPENIKEIELSKIIKEKAGDLLVRMALFDVFKKNTPEDGPRVSYAYKLVFQSNDKTLSDIEINEIMNSIYKAVGEKKGWQVR